MSVDPLLYDTHSFVRAPSPSKTPAGSGLRWLVARSLVGLWGNETGQGEAIEECTVTGDSAAFDVWKNTTVFSLNRR